MKKIMNFWKIQINGMGIKIIYNFLINVIIGALYYLISFNVIASYQTLKYYLNYEFISITLAIIFPVIISMLLGKRLLERLCFFILGHFAFVFSYLITVLIDIIIFELR